MDAKIAWLAPLYEILDTDFEELPERRTEEEVRAETTHLGPVEQLAWVLVHEMGTEGLDVLEPLVDRRGGERQYHAAVALTSAPPFDAPGGFGNLKAPEKHPSATLLTRLRDYSAKGDALRVWFFDAGILYSMNDAGKITTEIDDPETFVHALRAALL